MTRTANSLNSGWSPDGKWIALTDSRPDLRIVAADGSKEIRIGRTIGTEGPLCTFSPDSKWLAYAENTAPKHLSHTCFVRHCGGAGNPARQRHNG